jgi:hypothetical protein
MITVYASNKILDNLFGATGITLPSNYYVGLSTTTISSTGTGATEPVGNSYARVAVLNTKAYFSSAANGELSNLSSITFPVATGSWGTISHVFLSDLATGGNIWYFDALQTTRIVQSGATLVFLASALKFKMTNV